MCAYCGQSPPKVILEIDHIEPKSKGGADEVNNYITACFDCNRGKRDIPLDKIPSKLSENIEILKEKENQLREYRKLIKQIEKREEKDINNICAIFEGHFPDRILTEAFKKRSIKIFLDNLHKHEIEDAMRAAVTKLNKDHDGAIKYFCGICWKKIRNPGESLRWEINSLWRKLTQIHHNKMWFLPEGHLSRIQYIPLYKMEAHMNKALQCKFDETSSLSKALWYAKIFIESLIEEELIDET